MRPITLQVNGAGTSGPIALDQYISPFNVSLFIDTVVGTINATVEYTGDNIWDPLVVPEWFPHAELQNEVAAAAGTIIAPVSAVRVVNGAAGSFRLRIQQAGLVAG